MLRQINIKPEDKADIYKGSRTYGCGRINNDGFLYLIGKENNSALQLPEKYKDTPLILYHDCGGYRDGLIMVSLLPMDLPLQYHHEFADAAGLWGWIDLEGNEVIPPQYVYALSFEDGLAIVCAGNWDISDGEYWCNNERWGLLIILASPSFRCNTRESASSRIPAATTYAIGSQMISIVTVYMILRKAVKLRIVISTMTVDITATLCSLIRNVLSSSSLMYMTELPTSAFTTQSNIDGYSIGQI